jgi:hypothetical protein
VRVVKQGGAEHEQLLVSDSEQEPAVQATAASLLTVVADLATDEQRIAALGEAIARIAAADHDTQATAHVSQKSLQETQNV